MTTMHATPSAAMPRSPYGLMAEFNTPAEIYHAAEKTHAAGYKWFDCHVPFPVHGLDKAMGVKPTWLPIFVFGAGLTGTILGFVLQWFTNATSFDFWVLVPIRGYDFFISGKPFISGPAYIPVMFELTILMSAIGAVVLMLLFNGLPQLYHPLLKNDRFRRASDDGFFLVIEARDPRFSEQQTRSFLESLKPASIETIEP
jgi:hypothetical protein